MDEVTRFSVKDPVVVILKTYRKWQQLFASKYLTRATSATNCFVIGYVSPIDHTN